MDSMDAVAAPMICWGRAGLSRNGGVPLNHPKCCLSGEPADHQFWFLDFVVSWFLAFTVSRFSCLSLFMVFLCFLVCVSWSSEFYFLGPLFWWFPGFLNFVWSLKTQKVWCCLVFGKSWFPVCLFTFFVFRVLYLGLWIVLYPSFLQWGNQAFNISRSLSQNNNGDQKTLRIPSSQRKPPQPPPPATMMTATSTRAPPRERTTAATTSWALREPTQQDIGISLRWTKGVAPQCSYNRNAPLLPNFLPVFS